MAEFTISTTEILSRTDVIEAETADDALVKVKQLWKSEKIVLSGEDFQDVQFEVEE